MELGLGLKLQLLDSHKQRVLIVGQLAGSRNGDGWFRPAHVDRLLEDLRVPPGRTSRSLQQLEVERLVLRRSTGGGWWSLTALGQERALELFGDLEPAEVEAQLVDVPGGEFGHEI